MKQATLSIVIATFNSQKLLSKVLASVSKQTYPRSKIEILIVDGGSTDLTLTIARKFQCKVIHNPKVVPAWAKYIAYKKAKGKYIMYLDSDEVICERNSIQKKINLLEQSKKIKAVTGSGYITPQGYFYLNRYINEFGDPFSMFFYRLSKDSRFFIQSIKQRYCVVYEDNESIHVDFSGNSMLPIFELVAMGSVVDLDYLKKVFPEINENPGLVPHFFNLLVSKKAEIAIVKNDPLLHYSSDTWKKYLGKIRSRIINNTYTPAKEGFNGRNDFLPPFMRLKKYLFIPYALFIIPCFVDAIYLCITRKNSSYLIHVLLSIYTALLIIIFKSMKMFGIPLRLRSYGEEKIVAV